MHYFNDIRGIDTSANRRPLLIQYANDGNALIDMLTNEEPDDPYVDYAGGYIALRYMAKQFGGETFDYDEYRQKIKGDDIIFNYGSDVPIKSGAGDDSIESGGDNVTIVSGAGHDTINITGGSAWIKDYSARKDTLLLADGASTAIEIGFEEPTTEKIFGTDSSNVLLNVAKRHRDRTK